MSVERFAPKKPQPRRSAMSVARNVSAAHVKHRRRAMSVARNVSAAHIKHRRRDMSVARKTTNTPVQLR